MTERLPARWSPPEAAAQAGLFTARQAIEAGMTEHQVRRRLRGGRWTRVAGSALELADDRIGPWEEAHAAWLTWPDAVLGFGSAARLHRLPVDDDGAIHVVVPTARPPRHRLRAHRIELSDGDVQRAGSALVTTPGRTVIDCLGRLAPDQSDGLLAWVVSRRLLGADELARWIDEHPGAWGNVRRRAAVDRLRAGAASPAEWRLQVLLRRAGITGWRAGESLLGHLGVAASADIYFPEVRLVVEVDGRRYHGAERFQSDRTRQNALVAAGCTVLRYTWDDLVHRPTLVTAQIQAQLTLLGSGSRGM